MPQLTSEHERLFWQQHGQHSSASTPCGNHAGCQTDDCGIEPYIDLAGNDVGTAPANTTGACCAACKTHPQCKWFTFRPQDVEGVATCWLKTSDKGRHSAPPPDPHYSGRPGGGPPSPMPPAPAPPPPPPPHAWGSPPAVWNTLHVDGIRQVRARFPNGNPQDASGLCFSKQQHPGEGCGGYLSAQGSSGGMPGSRTVTKLSFPELDRNNAPLHKTDGGGAYGTFQYTIYDPPSGHPV